MENSSFGRLIGALIAPGKTFRSIAERPTWLVAFLVVVLSPLLPAVLAAPKIDWAAIAKAQIERADVQLTPEQMDKQIEITEKVGPIFTYATPVFMVIGVLLFALVFWGAFTLAGGELGFKRSVAVTAHGLMTVAVSSLLAIPIILGTDKIGAEVAQTGSSLKSNLAAFAPDSANPAVVALLAHLDVFALWSVVLFAIGFVYSAKVKPKTSAIVVGLLWLLYVGITVGFAALGMLMGGKRH